MLLAVLLPLVTILPLSLAKKITVDAGKGGLVFAPDTITADKGDTIEFTFFPQNHSVAESTLDKPCEYKSGGIFSGVGFGVQSGESTKVFTITVEDTDPHWLFCSLNGHCQRGMALVVNPAEGGKNIKDYQSSAQNVQGLTSQPTTITGGRVSDKGASDSSSTPSGTARASGTSTVSTSGSATTRAASTVSGTSSATGTASRTASGAATTSTGAAVKVGPGAGLGALGLLGMLAGMI